MKKNTKIFAVLLLTVLVVGASCKKMLDVDPENEVDSKNVYLTLADADAAVLGIYGKFLKLSKQYIILNELRADLMDITANADPFLKEISEHNVSAANPYANPRQFYELILNCNDALKGFNKMVKASRISVADYNRHYADIGALRSWLYLQVGIHYGNVPYITEPFESVDDLNKLSSYPKISFDALLDSLVAFTSALPYTKTTEVFPYPAGTGLNPTGTLDLNSFERFYITKPILLGDLYLWRGKYFDAVTNYKVALEQDQGVGGNNYTETFRLSNTISNEFHNGVQFGVIGGAAEKPQDENSLVTLTTQGWRSLFAAVNTDRSWQREWYWALPFNKQFNMVNPFTELFSNSLPGGKYLLKPSQAVIDNWNSQVTTAGLNFDPRGRLSIINNGGNPVITKFTDNIQTIIGGGQWNIWRAGGVHLHYAEAANRDGQTKLGWALLNTGIANTYSPGRTGDPTFAQLELMQSQVSPGVPFPATSPYYFDARNAGANNTGIRNAWWRNSGVRGRSRVAPYSVASQTDAQLLEDQLINEDALELAFEGQRWSDLLRVALRRNNPAFLADKVYQKLLKANSPAAATVRAKLTAKDWYLPFDIYK